MAIDLTKGCCHPSGMHLFSCHQVCQWCNRKMEDIELVKLRAEVGRLREFLQEAFPYIPQNIELARKIRDVFGTKEQQEGGGDE